MNRQFLWVAGILFLSVGASSFAQSPPSAPWVVVEGIDNAKTTPCLTDNGSGQFLAIFATSTNVSQNTINPKNGSVATNASGAKVTSAKVPPVVMANQPIFGDTACALSNGEISLFGRELGLNNQPGPLDPNHYWNKILTIRTTQGSFANTDWAPFPSDGTTDTAMSAASDLSTIYLLSRGIGDKRLYENTGSGGQWSGWSLIDPSFTTLQGPAAVVLKDLLFAFAIGANDQRAYMNTRTLRDKTWSGWVPIPGNQIFNEPLAATTDGQKTVWVFGIDHGAKASCSSCGPIIANRYTIQINKFDLPSKWVGWQAVPGGGETITAPGAGMGYVAMVQYGQGGKVYIQPAPK